MSRVQSSRPDVSAIVVSYNTRELTLRCIESIQEHGGGLSVEIIVVDNASRDGSADAVATHHPEVQLIANADNRGFATANNQAFERATGRYLLLLNPDAHLTPGALDKTLRFAEENERAGAVGCRVLLPSGEQQSTLFRPRGLGTLLINTVVPNRLMRRSKLLGFERYVGIDLDRVQDVEVVAGCFMLVRREVLEEVGGMDPQFFMYGEEAEWCYRIRQAGWSILYYPDVHVVHAGGQSAKQEKRRMNLAMARSQLLLVQRTQGSVVAWLANLLMLVRDAPRAAVWKLTQLLPGLRSGSLADATRPAATRLPLHVGGLVRFDWSD